MNPQQIKLVRDSFALVRPIAPEAAALFYANLFQADPTLRGLFRIDLQDQGERLMAMIASALGLLERPDALLPVLRTLGARHVGYGVIDSHYDTVGAALLKTLDQGLGEAFTPAVRQAWSKCYGLIAEIMQAGARQAWAEALDLAA